MKKFLSLVLALIMTMSLVTISAGATEYRDLTDKDEIQYEEAVAVLNRIGVITGYDDGSFRPETELTRGAAAKIIVSLLIGPEAASNLPNQTAPYPDVPASHTFAGVISYCKTAKIISGYGDGTFKPGNSLTGFAFAKMLLGALGYNSEIEGFVDTGWTMNVARIGHEVGLFDRLDFDGAGAVNRETACQLALNTLKATMVTYGGNTMVSGAQTLVVKGTQAMYVTSNNREINANINRRVINAANNEMTLEFGEAKFKDLRLEHDKYDPAYDEYGHPSNEWSYKKVTIGTFKLPADFTFDKQMAHLEDTVATKEKALGLRGYDTYSTDHRANYTNWSSAAGGTYAYNSPFDNATQITINGWDVRLDSKGQYYDWDASVANGSSVTKATANAPTLSEICDLTDNGVTVEVYVCPVDADFITNVVVTRTQLMKVKRIGSDYVTLEDIEPDSRDPRKEPSLAKITGYNAFAIDFPVIDVKDSNYDAYNALKDLKAGDRVAVVPFTADQGKTWEVGEAYVPETVSGAFTKVDTYANVNKREGSAVAITVGGTSYPINEWNKDMLNVTGSKIKATKKDVTLYLAKDGTALWADEIGNSDAWMVVGDYYQATSSNGKVGWYVHGWTIGGAEVDLDLGTIRGDAERYAPGELVYYNIAETGNGEYRLRKPNANGVSYLNNNTAATYGTKARVYDEPAWEYSKDGKVVGVSGEGVYDVAQYTNDREEAATDKYSIHSRNGALALQDWNRAGTDLRLHTTTGDIAEKIYNKSGRTVDGIASGAAEKKEISYRNVPYEGVKFIFVSFDPANGEVESIEFKSGVQNVDYEDLCNYNKVWRNVGTNVDNYVISAAEAYVNDKGVVKAVVIKSDSSEADLSRIAVITDTPGDKEQNRPTGAEGTLNGMSYAKQYVTGPNFSISDEKTGIFDRDYPIGTILVISEKDGVIYGKYFRQENYTNGNPDAIYVGGIDAVKRGDNKNSEGGFLVGQGDNFVRTMNTTTPLKATGNSPAVVTGGGENNEVYLLGNKYVSGFDTDVQQDMRGLVTVNSSTTFVDLRAYNNDTIDSMGDLLDYDLDSLRLRVLVNGALSTDTFRHAYVVIVERASKLDDAEQPNLTANASITGVPLTGETGFTNSSTYVPKRDGNTVTYTKTVKVEAAAGAEVTLGVTLTNASQCTGLSSITWTGLGTMSNTTGNATTVTVPATGTAEYTATVSNTDTTRTDGKYVITKVIFQVSSKAGDPSTPSGEGSIKDFVGTEDAPWDNSTTGLTVNTVKSGKVGADHKYTVFFDIDRTKAVKDGKVIPTATAVPTKVTYDVYLGDTKVTTVADTGIATLGNLAAGTQQTGNALLDSSAQLTVKVTSVEWSEVNVYYEFKNVAEAITVTPEVADDAPKSLVKATVDAVTSTNDIMTFKIKTGTVEGEITKGSLSFTATGFGGGTPTYTGATDVTHATNGVSHIKNNGTTTTTLLGTEPVIVTIDGSALGTTLTTYTVKADTFTDAIADVATSTGDMTATDTAKTITVEPERNGSFAKGTSLDLMVYTNTAIAEVGMLKVTVKDAAGAVVGTANVTATNISKAAGEVIHTTVSGDVDCSTYTVEATPVNFLKATGVELVNDTLHTYRVTFDRALDGAVDETKFTGTSSGSTAITVSDAVNEGSSVLITVGAAIADGGTIAVTTSGGPVDADGVGLKGTKTTFTFTTAGGWGPGAVT